VELTFEECVKGTHKLPNFTIKINFHQSGLVSFEGNTIIEDPAEECKIEIAGNENELLKKASYTNIVGGLEINASIEKIKYKTNNKCAGLLAAGEVKFVGTETAEAEGKSEAPKVEPGKPCHSIRGEGLSLQNVAQTEIWGKKLWMVEEAEQCNEAVEVEYIATSSGKGKEQWGVGLSKGLGTNSPFPAFVGTDVAPNKPEMTEMGESGEKGTTSNHVMAVPVTQSAVTVIVSLPVKAASNCEATEKETPKIESGKLLKEWEKAKKLLKPSSLKKA
jgi:hypothetical protein